MNIHSTYDLIPYLHDRYRIGEETASQAGLNEKSSQTPPFNKGNLADQSLNNLKYYIKTDDQYSVYNEKKIIQSQASDGKGTLIDTYA